MTAPQLLPPWPAERELTPVEVDLIKEILAPRVLDEIQDQGIDVLTLDGALVVRAAALGVAAAFDLDDAVARGLSMAIDALAVEREFS